MRASALTGTFKVRPRAPRGMLERIGGVGGVLGLLAMIGGLVLLGLVDVKIAAGVALIVVGLVLVLRGIVQGVMTAMGMDGML